MKRSMNQGKIFYLCQSLIMLVMLKMEYQADHLLGSQSRTRGFSIVSERLACLLQAQVNKIRFT